MAILQKIWTYELTSSTLFIDANYGLNALSILLKSGTGSVRADLQLANGVASTPIILEMGNPLTLGGVNGVPLDGIEIITDGIISIVGRQ
jgi:hypothetical protein